MTTLFQRLIGENLGDSDQNRKIGIHAFSGAINEARRGYLSQAKFADLFNMDSDQVQDAIALKDFIVTAPDKERFMRVFKDWLYMGEVGLDSDYTKAGKLFQRLQDEITDQQS